MKNHMNNPQNTPPIGNNTRARNILSLKGMLSIKCIIADQRIAVGTPQPSTPCFKTYDHLPFATKIFSFSDFCLFINLTIQSYNARLWGGLGAAQRRKGRPSPRGATTADCYVATPQSPIKISSINSCTEEKSSSISKLEKPYPRAASESPSSKNFAPSVSISMPLGAPKPRIKHLNVSTLPFT